MKSKLILFFTLSVLQVSPTVYAQKSVADSLIHLLDQPMADTSKVLLHDQIAYALMYSQPLQAIKYLEQGISMAKKIKYPRGIARTQNRLGSVYRIIGSYAKSLESHLEAFKVAESNENSDGMARALNNIGILYSDQNDSRKAINYYNQAKSLAEQINNPDLLEIVISNLGTDYAILNQLDSAQYYTRKAYDMAIKRGDGSTNILLINLGNINYRRKDYAKALGYYRQSIPVLKADLDNRNLSLTYFEMARLFHETNQRDSSLLYAKTALQLAAEVDNPKTTYDAAMLLDALYETVDISTAYEYYKTAMEAKDKIFNEQKMKQIHNLGFTEQLREQQRESDRILYESRVQTIASLVGIGVFIIIVFILYRNNRNRHKTNLILTAQKEELESTLSELKTTQNQLIQSEKMASLGELTAGIAHEIQNPLNFVKNYSEVNVELLEEMKGEIEKEDIEEIKYLNEALYENQQKIVHHGKQAESIVRGMVEISKRASGNRESTDINALATEYLRVAYYALQAKDETQEITIETRLDTGLPKLNVIPGDLGKVLQNLIGNAFYAVIAKQKQNSVPSFEPTVIVTTKKIEDKLEIRVADNGTGMSEKVLSKIFQPFFTTKPTGQGTGLGLSLSFDIITKGHGGKISVESKEGEGSEFIIQLPLNTQIPEPV